MFDFGLLIQNNCVPKVWSVFTLFFFFSEKCPKSDIMPGYVIFVLRMTYSQMDCIY